jgi:AAA15 family ATPase/GTPase
MSELLLDSLEIKGYRCFEHLTIEKLGRVNLIVGKNNVGKTALLEALLLLVTRGSVANYILQRRNEDNNNEVLHLSRLFNRNSPIPELSIKNNDAKYYHLAFTDGKFTYDLGDFRFQNYIFIETCGMTSTVVKECWENIELTTVEDEVNEAMKIILPNLLRIRLKDFPEYEDSMMMTKIPYVQIKDFDKPLPLKSFGDGLSRLFGILLALVNCKDSIFLIDEIENGFHYSILPNVWKLIFKTAKDLNVQVFATTHSKDCIEAFNEVANANDEKDDGMLIRLERQGEKIIAKTVVEERLALAIEHGVEMR